MRFILAFFYNIWKLYIGLVFVATLILFYPIFLVLLSRPKLKQHTFPMNVFWSRIVRILCFYAVEKKDAPENIRAPFVICANHTSYLDIFIMYSVYPEHRFLFMGKSEILKYPLVKRFFYDLNIPVDRTNKLRAAKSFIQARKALREGWCIVIFPEGGIPHKTPYLAPFKNGAFQLAKSEKVGILPLTFRDNYWLFSDPENILDPAFPGLARVNFHPFISAEQVEKQSFEQLRDLTFSSINRSLPQKND
ncbi:MAG: lysophospholipid acyltransferase family protein [Bacteroidota bacterium]